ncbi:MAG: hypothetical protein PHV68_08805 [Candidatus Gastranaerophilales bacterium]|nr:hypothetical protein [Candidatus Gastranaerophilales bacterium]
MNTPVIKDLTEEKIISENEIKNKTNVIFENNKKITLVGKGSLKVLTTV